ncbi:MAG: hypothetical protein IPL46_30825 [Saprospiraceae bacterium]|nr:hypothetical protein [Saprospiraceae bacterium]
MGDNIAFLFKNYEIVEFMLNPTTDDFSSGFHIAIDSNVNIDDTIEDKSEWEIRMVISISDKQNRDSIYLRLSSISQIVHSVSVQIDDNDSEEQILNELLQIVYQTSRGIIIEKTSNSRLKGMIIPIVPNSVLRPRSA